MPLSSALELFNSILFIKYPRSFLVDTHIHSAHTLNLANTSLLYTTMREIF